MIINKIISKKCKDVINFTEKEISKELPMNVSKSISEIKKLTPGEIIPYLEQNAKKIFLRDKNQTLYQSDNLLIVKSNGMVSNNIEALLGGLARRELTCSPKFEDYLQISENEFVSILSTPSQKLLPYQENSAKVPKETKVKFFNEIKYMVNNYVFNKEILANKDTWFVTDDFSKIIIGDWSDLSIIEHSDKMNILTKLKELLK